MTNFQAAAGFMMASRARQDLLSAQSELSRISSAMRWKQIREENEQEARNLLFQIKKQMLAIEQALPDEAAVLSLLQTRELFFVDGRLSADNFSSFADKEYFDATTKMVDELTERAEDLLESEKWQDVTDYHLFRLFADHCCSLYFLLRARELRETDEKQQGIFGQLFSPLTKDKAKPAIEAVARRFGQADRLNRFRDKLPSATIALWLKEEKSLARTKFKSTLKWLDFNGSKKCLEHCKRQGGLAEIIGEECGFNAHESFCAAVDAELRERGLPLLCDEIKAAAVAEPPPRTGSYAQFIKPQVDPKLLANIQVSSADGESDLYDAQDLWELYMPIGGNTDGFRYRTEAMQEWRPLYEYINAVLVENIWVASGEKREGPLHAAAVYRNQWKWAAAKNPLYRTDETSEWRPWKELIDEIKKSL